MQEKLFDESPPVEPTPAQLQSRAKKRAVDNVRQKRHRAKKRDGAPKNVTSAPQSVTLFTASPVAPELLAAEITFEMRLLMSAFEHLADVGESANRVSVCRALDKVARAENMDIFHAGRFLDGAIERGALPRLDSVEWVSIPREMLARLLAN